MSISVQNISFSFPNGTTLFDKLNFSLGKEKTGLVGPNGIGKSTLLDLLSQKQQPTEGRIEATQSVFCLPQNFQPFYNQTLAEVLGVSKKLEALHNILNGKGSEEDYLNMEDNWGIEDQVEEVLNNAHLEYLTLDRAFETLSGGEMSRLLFSRIVLQQADFVLLDEPTNHLDLKSRNLFYKMIENYKQGMLIVSHDRELLKRMDQIMDLSSIGISRYGGNFDFYFAQKEQEEEAKQEALESAQNTLKKRLKVQKKKIEDQGKKARQGKQKGIQSNIGKAQMNYFKNKNEQSTSKLKQMHVQQAEASQAKVERIANEMKTNRKITIDLNESIVPQSKRILSVKQLNYAFENRECLWNKPIDFEIYGPQRWCISGANGSGKTSLLKLILGQLNPRQGSIQLGTDQLGLIDQNLSMLKNEQSVLENINRFNTSNLLEGELRIRLARFLFFKEQVYKKVNCLSGGERMRLCLACLLATNNAPELLIIDEPTNNLDFNSLIELTNALSQFKGALIVVSHDESFLREIGIEHQLDLTKKG